jgi:hypothetical protein
MRRFLMVAALLGALALPATASADTTGVGEPPPAGSTNGMTMSIASASLTGRLVVTLQVTITCQPKPASEYPVFSSWEGFGLQAWVKQASGKAIAFGSSGFEVDPAVVCDGTPHTIATTVSADPSGPPFSRGTAVVAIAGTAGYILENWETGEFGFVTARASTGWKQVRFSR